MSDTRYLTSAEAAAQIASGKTTPSELTEHYLARIERYNPALSAFLTITPALARSEAKAAERRLAAIGAADAPNHALEGIPLAFKDIFETAGILTSGHSRVCIDRVPKEDAVSVARIKARGAVCLGKLATHEFAFGGPSFDLPWPPARNPWHRDHFSGGSSSGSGVAVAAGLTLGAFGSDTAGSIRLPAAYCGLVGLKPTYGRVSRRGVYPLAFSLDHVGPMAWTAEDCALMLEAMAGYDAGDPASVDRPVPAYSQVLKHDSNGVRGMRIGVAREFWEAANTTAETVQAMEAALQVFRGLGATVVELDLLPLDDFVSVCRILLLSEALAVHEHDLKTRPELFGEIVRNRMYLASTLSAVDYVQAMRGRRELCDSYAAATKDVDLVFTATTPGPAPRVDSLGWDTFLLKSNLTMPFNITGSPAIATRAGFSSTGLPLSFQLVGKAFDEATVLAAAHAYEKASDWHTMRPDLKWADEAIEAKA